MIDFDKMAFNKKPKTINPGEVDPSVYYYDEVYDEMQEDNQKDDNKDKVAGSSKEGSKYIKGLLETAKLRKSEKEIRVFKKYAKDREKARVEGDVDSDDVYVSSSYKKRLKEIEILEAEKTKRLSQEKDNRMNFSKQSDVNKGSDQTLPDVIETKKVNIEREEVGVGDIPIVVRKVKPKLNNIKDRRKFLRELLAKRTVGKTYDEAVQRYLERKSVYR